MATEIGPCRWIAASTSPQMAGARHRRALVGMTGAVYAALNAVYTETLLRLRRERSPHGSL